MSSLTRWDPIPEVTSLRDAMGQLFERAVMRPGFGDLGSAGGTFGPAFGAMNVFEAQGRYTCQALLPGASPDNIDLSVRQNTLTLKCDIAEPSADDQQKGTAYLLHEFGGGQFVRSIAFPKDVQGDAVEARFSDGILVIEIPIAEHAQPRRITIQTASDKRSGVQPQPRLVDEHADNAALAETSQSADTRNNRVASSGGA